MGKPSITVLVEPGVPGKARYLMAAPAVAGGRNWGLLNLALLITNNGAKEVGITKVDVKVIGAGEAEVTMIQRLDIPSGWAQWYPLPKSFEFSLPPVALQLRLRIHAIDHDEPHQEVLPLERHHNPGGAYRFWGRVRDLRPTEFWHVIGLHHSHDNFAQVHGYDVKVIGGEPGDVSGVFAGADRRRNDAHRAWGKPVYAIGPGHVQHFRNDWPTNEVAGEVTQHLNDEIRRVGDGNGNFFTIEHGGETVLYAHMIPGSLNSQLLHAGAEVHAGDYLGLLGNSGAAGGPHLHIHANRTHQLAKSWIEVPRPMNWFGARAVKSSTLGSDRSQAPWVVLGGRGTPSADCAVWPSDAAVVNLKELQLRHFGLSKGGRLFTLRKSNGAVRASSETLPQEGYVGAFMDLDTMGLAKWIALKGEQPYIVGSDNRVWEGTPTQWVPLPGSPEVRRMAFDDLTGWLWVVTTGGAVKSFRPGTRSWHSHAGGLAALDVCSFNGVPFAVGIDQRVRRSLGADGWELLPGAGRAKRISVFEETGKLWVVGSDDGVYAYQGNGQWNQHAHGAKAREIFVFRGRPFIVARDDDSLWRSAGTAGWARVNVVEPA
jgi:Peptidase family M23